MFEVIYLKFINAIKLYSRKFWKISQQANNYS